MRILYKLFAIVLLNFGLTTAVRAQQGFGTNAPAPSSVIDAVANNKGVLLPRVALTNTTVAAPVAAPANALTVFNTATTADVTPGYYYWSEDIVTPANSKWVKLTTTDDLQEPWKIQATTNNATLNDQNIYQKGKVAIGTTSATTESTKQLDVVGDFRTKYANGNYFSGIENNSIDFGTAMNLVYVANAADLTTATETSIMNLRPGFTNLQSKTGNSNGNIGTFSSSTGGVAGFSAGNATNDVTAQIWGYSTNAQSNVYLSHTKTFAESAQVTIEKLKGVSYNFSKADGTAEGQYTFPRNNGTNNQILTTDGNSSAQLVWKDIASIATNNWSLTGNAGTVPATNFLGTIDAQDLVFRTNNLERLRITRTGRLDLSNTSGDASNIFVEGGNEAVIGIFNTAVGRGALANVTTGNQNTALGSQSLSSVSTGSSNIGVGDRSLAALTTGQSNTTVGGMSGSIATSGNFNSIFGFQSASALTTGSANTFFGASSGSGVTTGSKNIAIGSNTSFASGTADNQLNIGNNIFGTGLTGTVTTPVGNIGIGTAVPNNTLEIKSIAANTSGLTFTNLNSSSPAVSGANLGVNAIGQVVVVPSASQTVTTITNTIIGHKIADYTNEATTPAVVSINETVTSLTDVITQTTDVFGNLTDIHTLTFKDENGNLHPIDLALLLKGKETLTSLRYDSSTQKLTYKDENGGNIEFNLVDLVGSAQTLTSLTINTASKTLDYFDENKVTHQLNLAPLVSEPWYSTTTNTGAISNSDNIYTQGWVGIGYTSPSATPNEKLRVNGAISAVNGYYADYVFEDYFKGFSNLKKDYKFKKLNEVDTFIKANRHLPGITPINELTKTADGYAFNVSELSVQLLEKTEELYLHAIEHQKQLEIKDREITDLKKRLEKLEALILKNN